MSDKLKYKLTLPIILYIGSFISLIITLLSTCITDNWLYLNLIFFVCFSIYDAIFYFKYYNKKEINAFYINIKNDTGNITEHNISIKNITIKNKIYKITIYRYNRTGDAFDKKQIFYYNTEKYKNVFFDINRKNENFRDNLIINLTAFLILNHYCKLTDITNINDTGIAKLEKILRAYKINNFIENLG